MEPVEPKMCISSLESGAGQPAGRAA